MKFSGKSCENFKKLGIKKKQEKFWENLAEFLKKFRCASFIENTAFYRAEYGLLSFKTWQHCLEEDSWVFNFFNYLAEEVGIGNTAEVECLLIGPFSPHSFQYGGT